MEDYRLMFKSFGSMSFLDLVKQNKEELNYMLNYYTHNTGSGNKGGNNA